MKAGLVSITFRQLTASAVVKAAAENGLEGIEWGGDVHVPHGDTEAAEAVARLTIDAGLEVASYGSYYRFEDCLQGGEGPSMASVLDTAEALGAPAIRLWAGQQGPADTTPEVWEAIIERSRDFAMEAHRRGMRIDFEFHENTLTETPESTCRLLEGIDHPAAHTLWQPPLMMSPAERLSGFRRVQPWVSNLHCNYFGQDPWPHVHLLAEGAEEWKTYLSEWESPMPGSWVLIEHVREHSLENFSQDALALRQWLSGPWR